MVLVSLQMTCPMFSTDSIEEKRAVPAMENGSEGQVSVWQSSKGLSKLMVARFGLKVNLIMAQSSPLNCLGAVATDGFIWISPYEDDPVTLLDLWITGI
jgi:hypothetical protein